MAGLGATLTLALVELGVEGGRLDRVQVLGRTSEKAAIPDD